MGLSFGLPSTGSLSLEIRAPLRPRPFGGASLNYRSRHTSPFHSGPTAVLGHQQRSSLPGHRPPPSLISHGPASPSRVPSPQGLAFPQGRVLPSEPSFCWNFCPTPSTSLANTFPCRLSPGNGPFGEPTCWGTGILLPCFQEMLLTSPAALATLCGHCVVTVCVCVCFLSRGELPPSTGRSWRVKPPRSGLA